MTEEEMKARIEALESDNDKLKADKHAALGEKNKANAAAKAAQEAADAAAEEAAEKAGDVEAIKASLTKKYEAQIAKLTEGNAKLTADLSILKIDNVIADAMSKNGVMAEDVDILSTFLKTGATIENGEAMVNGVPLAEHVSSFFSSERASRYVAAPQNNGAGATGNTTTTGKWTTPPTLAQMSEWARDAVTNPTQYNAMARQWNRPDLEV